MPLFRCMNADCGDDPFEAHPHLDFENDTGVCPKCGESHKTAPDHVLARVAVHYLVSDKAGAIKTRKGSRYIACLPAVKRLTGQHQCTGVREAVTCPKCLVTDVFKKHDASDADNDAKPADEVRLEIARGERKALEV